MSNNLTELIQQKIVLILIVLGLALIIIASTFHTEFLKIKVDHVMAEVGALFLIVGTLHWMFENSLRKEMLKDIASTALESTRIHDSGLVDCLLDSKDVSEINYWKASHNLIIGLHYSSRFLEHFHTVLKDRCATRKITKVCIVKPGSLASDYLVKSGSGIGDIEPGINRIKSLLKACGPNADNVQLYYHDRVLRYTFIYTEQFVWIKFFTNSRIRAEVPAFKVQAGTPLFKFFEHDIKSLLEQTE